jgi:integrase
VKRGTVYQRHAKSCPRRADGSFATHRCRGSWAYLVDAGRDGQGKRQQVGKGGFPTKAAARAALDAALEAMSSDVGIHSMTVGEYLDAWLAGKHSLKPKTVAGYRDAIDLYLRPGLGHIRLQDLRAHDLDRFYVSIQIGRRGRPLSPSTIRRIHAVLRSALNSAVKRRLLLHNPALHIELAPENPHRPEPWSVKECQTFLRVIAKDRLHTMYQLMIVTGLRRGEALGLRWSDVDLERAQLVVRQQLTEVRGRSVIGKPKTRRSQRSVALDAGTVAALVEHRARQQEELAAWNRPLAPDGLVFTKEDGRPVRPEYATRHFQALAREAKLREIRLHDLRHTSASLALAAGIEMKVVSDRLGHSTIGVTADLYTHVVPDVARRAADRMAAMLGVPRQTDVDEVFTPTASHAVGQRRVGRSISTPNEAPDRVSAGLGPAP